MTFKPCSNLNLVLIFAAPEQIAEGVEGSRRDNNTMVRSDSMYTTWSQLKQQSRGSDNGNTEPETGKSLSMPDLCGPPRAYVLILTL